MKFNFTNKGKDTTVNYMGAKAYRMTPERELYSTVVTCVVDDATMYCQHESSLN